MGRSLARFLNVNRGPPPGRRRRSLPPRPRGRDSGVRASPPPRWGAAPRRRPPGPVSTADGDRAPRRLEGIELRRLPDHRRGPGPAGLDAQPGRGVAGHVCPGVAQGDQEAAPIHPHVGARPIAHELDREIARDLRARQADRWDLRGHAGGGGAGARAPPRPPPGRPGGFGDPLRVPHRDRCRAAEAEEDEEERGRASHSDLRKARRAERSSRESWLVEPMRSRLSSSSASSVA